MPPKVSISTLMGVLKGKVAISNLGTTYSSLPHFYGRANARDGWGRGTTRVIRKLGRKSGLTIIGLSANVFPEDKKKGLDAGMDDYLGRPLDLKEFSRVTQELEKMKRKGT